MKNKLFEPTMGIEPTTPSLPRKYSTPELRRLVILKNRFKPLSKSVFTLASGRRGSNPRPIAWKAIALPTELLPLV